MECETWKQRAFNRAQLGKSQSLDKHGSQYHQDANGDDGQHAGYHFGVIVSKAEQRFGGLGSGVTRGFHSAPHLLWTSLQYCFDAIQDSLSNPFCPALRTHGVIDALGERSVVSLGSAQEEEDVGNDRLWGAG